MAVFGKILGAVGGLLGTAGNVRSIGGQASQLRFDASQDINSAELAGQDIDLQNIQGQQERSAISQNEILTRGTAKAQFADANVVVDTGSALDFDVAVAKQAASERAQSRDAEAVRVHRLRTEQSGLLAGAKLKYGAAEDKKKEAQLSAVGGVLQAVGGAFGGK